MINRILEFSLRQRAIVLFAAVALLETRREALEAGQQLELLTGLDIHAIRTNPASKSPKP